MKQLFNRRETTAKRSNRLIWPLILIGLVAASSASILIKLCEAPALVIAAYRLTIASLIFITITVIKYGTIFTPFSRRELVLAMLSGVFLSIHFGTWIASLNYTSVASSVLLVQTAPIFVAIGSFIFLKEKPTNLLWLGILVTICGGVTIGFTDLGLGGLNTRGDFLAMFGAIGLAGYWLAGRRLRAKIGILHYASVVYGTSALLLTSAAICTGASLYPYPPQTLFYLVLIAIVPQVIGHTSFNYGLRFLSAPVISVLALGEPVGATILAYFFLSEQLSFIKIIGAIIILIGVYITARSESKQLH